MALPKKNTWRIIFVFFLVFFIYFLIKNITSSVFLKNRDRVNVVFYSKNTLFYSLSNSEVNYLLYFSPQTKLIVPGGYGQYRVGSLQKLAFLEKNPEIIKKTFSFNTFSFVDLYFYPKKSEIYYQNEKVRYFPQIREILFYSSNANFFDRMVLIFIFFQKRLSDFKIREIDEAFLDPKLFIKEVEGNFYKKAYRTDQINVQIIYTKSYSTALLLSQIINGEGIRTVDISQSDEKISSCVIISKDQSKGVLALKDFFRCGFKKGEPEISDIIIKLGNLEKDWAYK